MPAQILCIVSLFASGGIVSNQLKVYGANPPLGLLVARPLQTPHVAVVVSNPGNTGLGSLILTETESKQLLRSLTVTSNEPAQRFVAIEFVCDGEVLQRKEYGLVPPTTELVAVPLHPPLQDMSVLSDMKTSSISGSDKVVETES